MLFYDRIDVFGGIDQVGEDLSRDSFYKKRYP